MRARKRRRGDVGGVERLVRAHQKEARLVALCRLLDASRGFTAAGGDI